MALKLFILLMLNTKISRGADYRRGLLLAQEFV